MTRDYRDYLQDIADAVSSIEEFIKGHTQRTFCRDLKTIYATAKAVEIIGEATKSIPSSLRKAYPEVPWKLMAGMRDKLVHHYFGIIVPVLWRTAKHDIPKLKPLIRKVLVGMDKKRHLPSA